jgi:hypothetical protein
MERRYLVAALAMIATFAGVSRGFQSLQQLSLRAHDGQTMSSPQCVLPSIVSRVLAKIKTNLHQTDPEEAQLLAEMNLPIAALEAKAAEQAAKQSQAAAERARQTAMREAERAHRDAMRMRDEMARQNHMATMVSIQVPDYAALNRRIQVQTAAMAQRMAAQSARIQIAAAKWQAASWQTENSAKRHSPCGARQAEMR